MRKVAFLFVALLALVYAGCYDDTDLKDGIEDLNTKYGSLEIRIAALEETVQKMNENIAALQILMTNLQNKVYVDRVEEIRDGYVIYFTDGTEAAIRNGSDGKDGEDGKDGTNGKDGKNAPVIGVAKGTDGVYYWTVTVDGTTTWLTDEGQKLRVTGKDGHSPKVEIGSDEYWYIDGVNTGVKATGLDGLTPTVSISSDGYWVINGVKTSTKAKGQDGTSGKDGDDGVTPQLKIDNEGYWTVSYDGGKSYARILNNSGQPVSAVGKDGEKGEDGKDGEKGEDGIDGQDGQDGHTPDIGIKQDTDGLYYWTKDGEWILDGQGKKVKAEGIDGEDGLDAIAPKLKIEDGDWMLSTDGGLTWVNIGQATGDPGKDGEDGDSFFKSVTEKEDRVTIELMTGEVIDLLKHRQLSITFSQTGEVVVMPGSSRTLSYTIEGGSENTLVKALGQNGWSARVEATSATEGQITITAPDPMTDDEIVVLVYDGQQTTVMSYLCCVQGVVNVANNYYDVPAAGGPVEVPVSTNINYSVYIPEEAKAWLSVLETVSRATLREETIRFSAALNEGEERAATVEIRDAAGKAVQKITFKQAIYALEVNVATAGTLKDLVTEDDLKNVRELKLTGSLNKADFEVLTGSFSELTKLDLSGVNLTALPSMAFMGATNVAEVILPENLATINEQDFRNCTSLRSVQLPEGLTAIKENAFGGCTSLTGIMLPANVTEIRSGAFKGCRNLSSFDIPDDSKLTLIGGLDNDGAFQGCVGLTEFSVPKGVTTIGTYAFNGCWALTTLTFANGSANAAFSKLKLSGR